jgi:hypothetical protein
MWMLATHSPAHGGPRRADDSNRISNQIASKFEAFKSSPLRVT